MSANAGKLNAPAGSDEASMLPISQSTNEATLLNPSCDEHEPTVSDATTRQQQPYSEPDVSAHKPATPVLFLGTGGYHPNERRHTASLMLPELGLVFDAGSSLFRMPPRLVTRDIDIFLTHPHLDHVMGLTFLIVPLVKGEIEHCRVHALPETIAAVKEHLFSQPLFPVLPSFEFLPLNDRDIVGYGRGVITHQSLQHPGGSLGYKLDVRGKQLAYITDTTVDGSYTEFIRGVDVLIHECYFPDEMAEWSAKTGHSNTSPVARLAKEAGVKRLYLVHIDPQRSDDDPIGNAAARAIFPETYLAEDLMAIRF